MIKNHQHQPQKPDRESHEHRVLWHILNKDDKGAVMDFSLTWKILGRLLCAPMKGKMQETSMHLIYVPKHKAYEKQD